MRITAQLSIILMLMVSKAFVYGQCNPKPIANFSVKDVCEDDSSTFVNQSQNTETYIWKFGDGQKSNKQSPSHLYNIGGVNQTFNVILVALDSNGCSDSIIKAVTVNAIPKSDYTYTYSGKNWCFNAADLGAKYRWFFGDGDSANIKNPCHTYKDTLSSHKVCLEVTSVAGCISLTCVQLKPVGISPLAKHPNFKIYPNPNSGSFTIEFEATKTDNYIEIINQIGQAVYKEEFNQNRQRLDLNLSKGIYMVKVISRGEILIHRILVNK